MRISCPALMLLALLPEPAGCKPQNKRPAVGSQELLGALGQEFRVVVKRDYPTCDFGTAVVFDGTSKYTGKAIGDTMTLVFRHEGDAWSCVDAESRAPTEGSPCQVARAACK